MSTAPHTFVAVDDQCLAAAIDNASKRVVFAAPGLGRQTGQALADAITRLSGRVTVVLDADPDACRVGYGDPEALRLLHEAVLQRQLPLRKQEGLRIGVLVADDAVLIWSPIARSVEAERSQGQPNGLALTGTVTDLCSSALGDGGTATPLRDAEIGRAPLTVEDLKATLDDLQRSPPAPFDLARRTRVFSSRFQFVECEIRGAHWTERKINLSSVLLNADLTESLRDVLDTQIHPYKEKNEVSLQVPHLVGGIRAFDANAKRIMVAATQSEVLEYWSEIQGRYLKNLPGFGWLIKRDDLEAFRDASAAFEETLHAWVDGFRKQASGGEDSLVKEIVNAIQNRFARSKEQKMPKNLNLEQEVRKGLDRMRVIEPRVRIVLKNVAWESTRDDEFQSALEKALPAVDREGWFEEFTAARERPTELGLCSS